MMPPAAAKWSPTPPAPMREGAWSARGCKAAKPRSRVAIAHPRQRGVALLVVLWACTLLAILLGGYATLARTEGMQARYQFAQTQAHYAAEAGLARAVYGLQDPVAKRRWLADGRPYSFSWGDAVITLSATDEGGKVDLNAATPESLQGFFRAVGVKPDAANKLAAAVVDWRSLVAGDGPSASLTPSADPKALPPRHAPFASIEELQQVSGMTPALYQLIAGQITIWSGRDSPDPNTAPPLAMMAIPGMTPAKASALAAARLVTARDSGLVASNGTTHSIRSEATMADGTRAILRATVRLQGTHPNAAYTVLHWQEGEGE